MSNKIRVIFFKEGDTWVAQGLERDICVQATSVEDLYGRFEVAVDLERDDEGKLDHIGEAPQHFFDLWENRAGSVHPRVERDTQMEYALAA